jgi:hypothetical protein
MQILVVLMQSTLQAERIAFHLNTDMSAHSSLKMKALQMVTILESEVSISDVTDKNKPFFRKYNLIHDL